MKLYQLLDIRPGVTAVIGSGGKTSLISHLLRELTDEGHTVLLATTTHIRRPAGLPYAVNEAAARELLGQHHAVCVGANMEEGKVSAPAFAGWERLAEYTLVEADGSRMKPLKAHAPHEPVIPPTANQTICVVGLSGFCRPIVQSVHRPEYFCGITGATILDMALPRQVARVIAREGLCTRVYLNQLDLVEEEHRAEVVREFAEQVSVPVVVGSLTDRSWRMVK